MSKSEVQISINARRWPIRIFLFCLIFEILLVALDALIAYGALIDISPIRRLFNITREDGLATWFMVIQTFVAAVMLCLIAVVQHSHGAGRGNVMSWGLMSAFFLYMSADDAAEIHERLGSTFKALQQGKTGESAGSLAAQAQNLYPSYDWQLVVLPFLAGAGLLMMVFLLRQFRDGKSRAILLAAISIMAVAVSLDFFEGLDESHPLNLHSIVQKSYAQTEYTVSHFSKSLEEFLEMLSISLLLMLFIGHLISCAEPRISIHLKN